MLDKKQLEEFKSVLNFNLGQTEKDYLQHLFLLFLSRNIKDEIIFKGGTALQKAYALNRFSEDLDFTFSKVIDLDKLVKKISQDMVYFGFKANYEKLKSKTSKNYRLRIKGPLFDGGEKTIASLRIEISLRNDLILEPDLKEIIPVYPDTQPYAVLIMKVEEILAEKIRTILQREKARDIYDTWFLLIKGVKLDRDLIEKKCKLYNLKFEKNIFLKKMMRIRKVWKEELSGYVSIIPDFNAVVREIKRHF